MTSRPRRRYSNLRNAMAILRMIRPNRSRWSAAQWRPFTVDELRAILEVATPEWQSLIKFGLYTGQRLGDLARLTWSNLDLERNVIRLQARKTGKAMTIPIAEPLRNHILCLPVPSKPSAPIHPRAFRTAGHRLSNQFVDLLVVVGLRQKQKRTGAGRGGRRQPSEVSFHVLRHTCTTLLKHAGVPQAVVQELIGHQSPAMSGDVRRLYSRRRDRARQSDLSSTGALIREAIPD